VRVGIGVGLGLQGWARVPRSGHRHQAESSAEAARPCVGQGGVAAWAVSLASGLGKSTGGRGSNQAGEEHGQAATRSGQVIQGGMVGTDKGEKKDRVCGRVEAGGKPYLCG
jgi:hypothetical protein